MAKLTITEALAEVKTISSRVAKKREAIMRYFSRDNRLRDPLEGEGGSREFVRRERQAIRDLENRLVRIRSAIQDVNLRTPLAVNGSTRTVAEWLNWRREVSAGQKTFLSQMAQGLTAVRQNALRQGMAVTDKESYAPGDVVVSVSEQELSQEIEELENVLGLLDGKLSLLNATTTIDV